MADIDKHKRIIDLMNKINSSINLQILLPTIIDSAKDILNCEGASLLLLDEENDELIFDIVISEKGEIIQGKRLEIGEGIAGHVAKTEQELIVNDVTKDSRFFSTIDLISGFVTRNIAAVPVKIKSKLIGVLEVVNSLDDHKFNNNDIKFLENIADAAAIAINNHEMMINLKNRVDELTCIYEISQSIYFTFNIEEFLLKILHAVNRVIKAQRCSFMILDEDGKNVKYFVSTTGGNFIIDLENTLMYQVIKTGDPFLVYNIDENLDFAALKIRKRKAYKSKSFLCVPMKLREKIIGVLNVTDKSKEGIFDSFDLRVLSTIANQVAETYENVTLQKYNYEMEKIDKELQIAANIQRHSFSVVPNDIEGIGIGAFTLPSHFVSGDFFEITVFDENYFGCSVGDVSGKGIPAAIYMNIVRNVLRFEAVQLRDPVELVSSINKWVCRESRDGMFCTFFYCLIDRGRNEFNYCSAGHNSQMFYDSERDEFEYLKVRGKPLGIVDDTKFQSSGRNYKRNDMLILFSDGLAEKNNEAEIYFDDFIEIIKDNKDKDAEAITNKVKEILMHKSSDRTLMDDCTLLIVKFY